jgi:hypothetical protein
MSDRLTEDVLAEMERLLEVCSVDAAVPTAIQKLRRLLEVHAPALIAAARELHAVKRACYRNFDEPLPEWMGAIAVDYNAAQKRIAELEAQRVCTPGGSPIFTTHQLLTAVNASCSCGGKGPADGCCPACSVWHILHGRTA